MVGRAGRLGFDTDADSFLITPNKELGMKIISKTLEHVRSSLQLKKIGLPRVILEAVGTGLAKTESNLIEFLKTTLFWVQRPKDELSNQLNWLF